MLTKSFCVCLVTLAIAPHAFSQSVQSGGMQAVDMQKILDRLDRLENENRQLLDEIRELRSELNAGEPSATGLTATSAAPTSVAPTAVTPTIDERVNVVENRTAELDQSKVSASQRYPISLTGMFLFNAFANGKASAGTENPVAAGSTPTNATDGATLRQTILGVRFNGPNLPGGGTASGSLYMDFFAGSAAPYNNLLHIRTANLDLTWNNTTVTFGQDKPLISPRDPSSFAQVGVSPLTAAGNLWDWNPQVRIEQRFLFGENTGLKAQTGVYETTESYSAALPAEYAASLEHSRPAWQGRLEFYHGNDRRRFEIAPGFSLGATHVAGASVSSSIASVDWLVRPFPLLEFTGEAFDGQDVAGLGALPGFSILASGAPIGVRSHGEWGQIALFPTAKLSLHIYSGEQANRPSDLSGPSIQRNFVYAANAMYQLAPNVVAALEAAQARTEYLGSMLRMNNHYDLAIAYLF